MKTHNQVNKIEIKNKQKKSNQKWNNSHSHEQRRRVNNALRIDK